MDYDKLYYVYVILDTRKSGLYKYNSYTFNYEPFYIGKGKKDRKNSHFHKSRLTNCNGNKLKINVINKIIEQTNELPSIGIIKSNLTESEAFILEKELILLIGRRDLNSGTLCNLTDGGEGHSGSLEQIGIKNGFYGKKHKKESFSKIRKMVKQLTIEGEYIKTFDSLTQASIETNSIASKISTVAKGYRKTHNGFKWEFVDSVHMMKYPSYIKTNFKYIAQIDIQTNKIINTFDSITKARQYLNLDNRKGGLVMCLSGKRNTFGGFKWIYIYDEL